MKKSCLNCKSFQLSESPPKMRSCMYPGKIEMNGAFCSCWSNAYSFIDRLLAKYGKKKLAVRSLTI